MIDYSSFYTAIKQTPLAPWCQSLVPVIENRFDTSTHGHIEEWALLLSELPEIVASEAGFNQDVIKIGCAADCDPETRATLEAQLKKLKPWRKGPFELFGLTIDTEWRSDFKWNRIKSQLSPLQGRMVLDVGCGSGYHCLRMLGDGAALVIGIEPLLRYIAQFYSIKNYVQQIPVHLVPLALEVLPQRLAVFDTVFSMGVLYHRKSPFEHLVQLKDCLRSGGELVLETLVIDSADDTVLTPVDRYAKMRNVWFIPSGTVLERWLERIGFSDIKLVNKSVTTIHEQRSTAWMDFESLPQFLDPDNNNLTIEGYPAPCRATYIAKKP